MKKLLMKWFGISATKQLPFDIEAVKKGAKCVTRHGREAVYAGESDNPKYPHLFQIREVKLSFTEQGSYWVNSENDQDLFIVGDPSLREVLREIWKHPLVSSARKLFWLGIELSIVLFAIVESFRGHYSQATYFLLLYMVRTRKSD